MREGDAAAGQHALTLSNSDPGRLSQALQGFALDGRQVPAVTITASLWSKDLRPSADRTEPPGVVLFFFDQNRKSLGLYALTPSRDEAWEVRTRTFPVPPLAREAILSITLGGGTGEMGVDNVTLTPVSR